MFIIYTIMRSLPADYVETVARELSTKPGSSEREWIRRLNVMYGLDQNIVKGFFNWLEKLQKVSLEILGITQFLLQKNSKKLFGLVFI